MPSVKTRVLTEGFYFKKTGTRLEIEVLFVKVTVFIFWYVSLIGVRQDPGLDGD